MHRHCREGLCTYWVHVVERNVMTAFPYPQSRDALVKLGSLTRATECGDEGGKGLAGRTVTLPPWTLYKNFRHRSI